MTKAEVIMTKLEYIEKKIRETYAWVINNPRNDLPAFLHFHILIEFDCMEMVLLGILEQGDSKIIMEIAPKLFAICQSS